MVIAFGCGTVELNAPKFVKLYATILSLTAKMGGREACSGGADLPMDVMHLSQWHNYIE